MPPTPNALLRLRKHADYQRVYQATRKQHTKQMAYFFSIRPADRRSDTPGPRIGLTVPKALGNAVDRNRIKRRLREVVRAHATTLAAHPVDVILHPRRTVLTQPTAELAREVAQIFRTIQKLLERPPGTQPALTSQAAVPQPQSASAASDPRRSTPGSPSGNTA